MLSADASLRLMKSIKLFIFAFLFACPALICIFIKTLRSKFYDRPKFSAQKLSALKPYNKYIYCLFLIWTVSLKASVHCSFYSVTVLINFRINFLLNAICGIGMRMGFFFPLSFPQSLVWIRLLATKPKALERETPLPIHPDGKTKPLPLHYPAIVVHSLWVMFALLKAKSSTPGRAPARKRWKFYEEFL